MKFYIKTFGCQMNEHDSEIIAGLLLKDGYEETSVIDNADIIIANTCCIRESAENKIWGFIGNIKNYKYKNPNVILAVLGCMTQQKSIQDTINKMGRHIDIVLGTYQQHRLPEYISRVLAGSGQIIDISQDNNDFPDILPVCRTDKYRAQVNIIYGCNNFCSYCIVPYVRGRERSRDFNAIVNEVKDLAADGCKEITLLGQNVNSYGKDRQDNDWSFAKLLVELDKIDGIERIRYMSSHPRDFSLDLVDTIATLPKVCSHFHLPLQSGCDKTLKAMNRGYDTAKYKAIIDRIRAKVPNAAVTTDIIVGFPGETEGDFQKSLDFVKECKFDSAFTFLYSKRSGTVAAKNPDQVSEAVKKERLQRLLDVQNANSLQINNDLVNKIIKVLVEGVSKTSAGTYTGRSAGNKVVVFPGGPELVGKIVDVKIDEAKTWHLAGKVIG